MVAVCAHTGRLLDRQDDISQSVLTILTTPIGSRVRRRDYGSLLPDLVDSPANAAGILAIIAATADAITRWERRVVFNGASVDPSFDGQMGLFLDLTDRETGEPIRLTLPLGTGGGS